MRVLVVCQHYWPEPYPLQDICEEMVRRGHKVDLITGVPNYPLGYIYPEYKKGKNRRQTVNGVNIVRTFTIGRRNNLLFRFLNYLSFMISSVLYALRTKEEYDVVFTNQTSPVLMSSAALAYGKKHGKKVVLYCMDLWPASLKVGGVS
ncbi:MAG: glycosyltransferase, partial [Oscillospiraceae bacterium]|nr:glycosyltransferase [Oscillospiraceae bacterium]